MNYIEYKVYKFRNQLSQFKDFFSFDRPKAFKVERNIYAIEEEKIQKEKNKIRKFGFRM